MDLRTSTAHHGSRPVKKDSQCIFTEFVYSSVKKLYMNPFITSINSLTYGKKTCVYKTIIYNLFHILSVNLTNYRCLPNAA